MATIYEQAAEEVAEAFEEEADAQRLEISRKIAGVYDPIAKTETGCIVQSGYIFALRIAASKSITFYEAKYHEDLISGRAISLLVPADSASFEPEEGDELAYDGEQWRCLGATPVNPAGTDIVYRVGFMRL